jgi:hypothetical protein
VLDKEKGELAELGFIYEVKERKLGAVLLPFGDSAPYDVAVDNGDRIIRVQVKSAHVTQITKGCHHYHISVSHGRNHGRAYKEGDFDVLAATVMPTHSWYLIAAEDVLPRVTISLYDGIPDKGYSRGRIWEKYLDRWDLLV